MVRYGLSQFAISLWTTHTFNYWDWWYFGSFWRYSRGFEPHSQHLGSVTSSSHMMMLKRQSSSPHHFSIPHAWKWFWNSARLFFTVQTTESRSNITHARWDTSCKISNPNFMTLIFASRTFILKSPNLVLRFAPRSLPQNHLEIPATAPGA